MTTALNPDLKLLSKPARKEKPRPIFSRRLLSLYSRSMAGDWERCRWLQRYRQWTLGVSRLVGAASGLAQPPAGWHNVSRGQRPAAACSIFLAAAGTAVQFGALSDARQASDPNWEGKRLTPPAARRLRREARPGTHSDGLGTLLAPIWRPCASLAREIGAKGCLRR